MALKQETDHLNLFASAASGLPSGFGCITATPRCFQTLSSLIIPYILQYKCCVLILAYPRTMFNGNQPASLGATIMQVTKISKNTTPKVACL